MVGGGRPWKAADRGRNVSARQRARKNDWQNHAMPFSSVNVIQYEMRNANEVGGDRVSMKGAWEHKHNCQRAKVKLGSKRKLEINTAGSNPPSHFAGHDEAGQKIEQVSDGIYARLADQHWQKSRTAPDCRRFPHRRPARMHRTCTGVAHVIAGEEEGNGGVDEAATAAVAVAGRGSADGTTAPAADNGDVKCQPVAVPAEAGQVAEPSNAGESGATLASTKAQHHYSHDADPHRDQPCATTLSRGNVAVPVYYWLARR